MIRTVCGSFIVEQKTHKMLGKYGVAQNIYAFSGHFGHSILPAGLDRAPRWPGIGNQHQFKHLLVILAYYSYFLAFSEIH